MKTTPTPRQLQIAKGIASGKLNKEVADDLGISVRTAETHRYKLMHGLGLRTTADLVRWVLKNRKAPHF